MKMAANRRANLYDAVMPEVLIQMLPQFLAHASAETRDRSRSVPADAQIEATLQPPLQGLADGKQDSLNGASAVVIDVLRASTTMIHALAHGATSVLPCLTVDSAMAAARDLPLEKRLLGGERHGKLIPGFDLGNSPLDYPPDVVKNKTLIFTTTNGTRALLQCRSAVHAYIGAFVNRSAIVTRLAMENRSVHFVCAGTDGHFTAEDILFAGAAASDLVSAKHSGWTVGNLQAQLAMDYFQARSRTSETFRSAFFQSRGAQNLLALGMTRDIERAMEMDLFDCVPEWNSQTGLISLGCS